VLPPLAGFLAAAFAWQLGLGYVIPFIFLTTIGIWITVPPHSTSSSVDSMSRENTAYILSKIRQPNILFMTLILLLFIFIWQSFSAFYPTYLVEEKDLTATAAAILFGVFFACGVVVKPIAGSAYDRIGMRMSLLIVLPGPVIGFILLPSGSSIGALLLVTITVSTMLGSGAITQSYLADTFPADMRGTGLGAIRTTAATIGAIGPVAFGIIAEAGYFNEGYYILAIIMLIVIELMYIMPSEAQAA
jgi:MFS family permease